MIEPILGNGEILPEALEFLNWGWWVVHVVAIVVVFLIGWGVGKKGAAPTPAGASTAESAPGDEQ